MTTRIEAWHERAFPRPFYFGAWMFGRWFRFGWQPKPRGGFTFKRPRLSAYTQTRGTDVVIEVYGYIFAIGRSA